jgi:hypothetical protein
MRHPTSPRSVAAKRCHDPIFVPSHKVFVTPHPKQHKQGNLTSSCTGTRLYNFLLKETVNLHYCCLNLAIGFTKTSNVTLARATSLDFRFLKNDQQIRLWFYLYLC